MLGAVHGPRRGVHPAWLHGHERLRRNPGQRAWENRRQTRDAVHRKPHNGGTAKRVAMHAEAGKIVIDSALWFPVHNQHQMTADRADQRCYQVAPASRGGAVLRRDKVLIVRSDISMVLRRVHAFISTD
jgi:hypothetical protein